jgi:CheY-like chemotaxis protein/glycine cleavage system H lipoate-binding protein
VNKKCNLVIIDDEQVVLEALKRVIGLTHHSVQTFDNGTDALAYMATNEVDLVFCDIMMQGLDGFQIMQKAHERSSTPYFIIISGYSTMDMAIKSLQEGAIDFIAKPFTADEILSAVHRGIKYTRLMQKVCLESVPDDEILFVPCPARFFRLAYHNWVVFESDGTAQVGFTDLFIKTTGSVKKIDPMAPDEEIFQGTPCAYLHTEGDLEHPYPAPVSGRIVNVNQKLIDNPTMAEKDPYFSGWLYRIIPSAPEGEKEILTSCSSDRL